MEAKTMMFEVLPFIVMVIMEGCAIELTIFAKTAITNGMSPFVFIVYTNALATIILFPCSFLLHQEDRKERPRFTLSLFMRFLLLGFTGITMTQTFLFLGLSYSSPILVCAMGHLIPTFNFLISLVLRKTEWKLRSPATLVKMIGMIVSIMGAVLVEFFKGPLIRPSSHHLRHTKQLFVFSSAPEFWVLGGILLAAASFSVAIWNFIQKETVQQYPEPMKVVSYYSLLGTILSAMVSCIVERDTNAWKLKCNMELILVVMTALIGGVIRPSIQVWFSRMKGPLYVTLFKPFGIAFATTFGVCFFPNSLHYGSVIGATIIGMGYYTLMYGQIKGDEEKSCDESTDSLDTKIPLLQEKIEV
ncbi:WAT1-related protein At1g70260 [Abrus precatorius]|uniref:WAT1-related protein n=1 Tax=Abrus precatorius TaxID=3816 RepID=A0A8B8K0G5_ABRPR|nr:WAT1-related protein At1g70260 [Abrus precatorius]